MKAGNIVYFAVEYPKKNLTQPSAKPSHFWYANFWVPETPSPLRSNTSWLPGIPAPPAPELGFDKTNVLHFRLPNFRWLGSGLGCDDHILALWQLHTRPDFPNGKLRLFPHDGHFGLGGEGVLGGGRPPLLLRCTAILVLPC